MHALVLVTVGLVAGSGPSDCKAAVAYEPTFKGVWVGRWWADGKGQSARIDGRRHEVNDAAGVAVTPCTLESDGPGRVRLVVVTSGRRQVYLRICRPEGPGALLCISFRLDARSTRFATNSETVLLALRAAGPRVPWRAWPPPLPRDECEVEAHDLQGTWRTTSLVWNGKSDPHARDILYLFSTGNRYAIRLRDFMEPSASGHYGLHPSHRPQGFDFLYNGPGSKPVARGSTTWTETG